MTVLEIIQKSATFLDRNGIESPRLHGEHIVAHVLAMPRMQLYLEFNRLLSEEEMAACRKLVQQRARHVPLQHLVGSVSFCGLEIRVTPDALIPRPETELLVEQTETLIRQAEAPTPAVLDFGTGTGCIAVAIAARNPAVHVTALEVSAQALELARRNAVQQGVDGRIDFILGDGIQAVPQGAGFDVIVSNPPYIPSADIERLQPEVRDHDPRLALDGGRDGLDFYRMLSVEARDCLRSGAGVVLELGDGQASPVTAIFRAENWIVGAPVRDYSDRERCLIARRPE